jgi:glycopeptide antibiotics resistance protein
VCATSLNGCQLLDRSLGDAGGGMLIAVGLWNFISAPVPLVIMIATVLFAVPGGRKLATWQRCSPVAAVLLILMVGVVAALTLTPNPPAPGVTEILPPHYLALLAHPRAVWAQLTAPPADGEQQANIALFVPIGVLAALVFGTIPRATLFGAALTVFVETCQYGIAGRAGSFTDIRNNTLGALLGAIAVVMLVRSARPEESADPGPAM